ncbi:MAG: translation initiation factor IF-2 [Alphaproteobacteria bacterium]|nr:translation initiation factor IF-2 [Alphaproteobacteria bacterium]
MTKDNEQNTTRARLTLKLPTSINPQNLAPKSEKKLSSSAVQVTIKGRRKETGSNESETGLNKSELEARIRAVSGTRDIKTEIKTHDVLSKLKRKPEQKSAPKKEEPKKEKEEVTTPEKPKHQVSDYKLDQFDVRNKIRQSVEIANRQKEEREKILGEKKQQEQQRITKEKEERDKKKQKKSGKKNFTEEENKKKPSFKEERGSTRRLTYIINTGSEESESATQKRKKSKSAKHPQQQEQTQPKEYKKISREVVLPELITVADLAERMTEKAGDVVKKLFTMGMVVTSNQAVDADTAEIIVTEFGHKAKRVSGSDVENVLETDGEEQDLTPRAPIVTIMGHVDHGKTSLLDALRETDVAAREHGGITQHIGASRIQTGSGKFITFLDTPGHEAFTEMRSRGANVTDIVVLVVAADDGVKEQTIEAINHAKAANVPMIVAVNKIDKPDGDPQRVKHELLSHHVVAEDLGGDVIFVPVSAKTKKNLDKLEEAILLQAEILDLKAAHEGKAAGVVLESRIDPSRGVVATLLVQKGTLDTSDIIVVGTSFGRVRKMSDDAGKIVHTATPSVPVEVLGLDSAPNAGDKFFEVNEERQAREIIAYRARKEREEKALKDSAKSFADILKESGKGKLKYLNIIVKGDVHGSVEAIIGSVAKLNTEEVAVKVVHYATGGISDSDISLAAASGAIIIGFNVRATASAKEMAQLKAVEIRYYSIIYNLVDELKLMLTGMLAPTKSEEHLGQAEIRQIFKISGAGKVAGCFVTTGLIKRQARARLLRDNVVIHDGSLKTLKRFKEDVKEVKHGFECGIAFENYDDIKEKDVVECYEVVEQRRTL